MKTETYSALLKDLQKLQKTIVASQTGVVRRDPRLTARLTRLHAEAEVGGRLDDFIGTTVRKSTVLFLLRTVFVRVLEDLGILRVKRIRDEWGFAAFREVAPALGLRAYFAFIFRDLAVDFPALFAPGDDELPLPDEDNCRGLWNLWHHPNREGELYIWNGDGFDSRFLGDLYQDLDADIRKRYALLQTPRFVEEYILDHTLTPALGHFDPETLRMGGERFRMLDPTCGSGHFLIGAFHRLADYWRARHNLSEWAACERALESVYGCDINPHAVEIANFRLLLEVVARTGVKDLERLAELKLNLSAMDSLIPWELATKQGDLFPAKDRLDAYATLKQRRDNGAFLGRAFQVVVGNPPYIAPRDSRKSDDYRAFWPNSATGKYALSSPFVERFLVLGGVDAYVGQITATSFTTREFGLRLVETVLPRWDITGIVNASMAAIPGHGWRGGTPTLILFARSRPPTSEVVWTVLAKRGEPPGLTDPAVGRVWLAIVEARDQPNDDNPYVSVELVPRLAFRRHPWSLGGGAIGDVRQMIFSAGTPLRTMIRSIGNLTKPIEDDLYFDPPPALRRAPMQAFIPLQDGKLVRDWSAGTAKLVAFPYDTTTFRILRLSRDHTLLRSMWPWRSILWKRRSRASKFAALDTIPGAQFYEYPFFGAVTLSKAALTYSFVNSHNHFSLLPKGTLCHQSAPAIVLKTDDEESRFELLGCLNSSVFALWMRSTYRGTGQAREPFEERFQQASKKMYDFPVAPKGRGAATLARALDATARKRAECLPSQVLAADTWSATSLRSELAAKHDEYLGLTRIMVALQEELDWLVYRTYGLVESIATLVPDAIEPLAPGHRPFEIVLARKDSECDDDERSTWWSRHGHERVTEIPALYSAEHRARIQQRIDLVESDSRLALLETPSYKRRWQLPDWPSETKKAAESWLVDRLEDLFAPGTESTPRGPLANPKPYRLEDIAAAWSRNPKVATVAGVWTGTGLSVDITLVAERLLRIHSLPDNPNRLYSDEGLRKLDEWKRVWALQDQEDAWETAAARAREGGNAAPRKCLVDPDAPTKEMEAIPLPRRFDKGDFLKPEFFSIRDKLNVPRERFILFADLYPNRFGWNGWRDRERALAQVDAFTLAESNPQQPLPVPTTDDPRRCGVTYGLWDSLADVRRWGATDDFTELQALAREACRQQRCPCPIIGVWKAKVLDATAVTAANAKTKGATTRGDRTRDQTNQETSVSIAARAWVAALFQPGKDLEAATVWSRHQNRLSEQAQGGAPKGSVGPSQLSIPELAGRPPSDLVALDQGQLARVLDDLVASGDLQVSGRGSRKRFQLIPRGPSS